MRYYEMQRIMMKSQSTSKWNFKRRYWKQCKRNNMEEIMLKKMLLKKSSFKGI